MAALWVTGEEFQASAVQDCFGFSDCACNSLPKISVQHKRTWFERERLLKIYVGIVDEQISRVVLFLPPIWALRVFLCR